MKQLIFSAVPSPAAAADCLPLVRAAYGAGAVLAGCRPGPYFYSYTHNSRKFTATGKTAALAALASSDLLRGWLSPLSSAAYVYDSRGRFLGLVSK